MEGLGYLFTTFLIFIPQIHPSLHMSETSVADFLMFPYAALLLLFTSKYFTSSLQFPLRSLFLLIHLENLQPHWDEDLYIIAP